MKTKKEHPAGDQVQDLITFFGHERLSVEDHFKVFMNMRMGCRPMNKLKSI